jgi:ABC-type amino acid transport substrate-binding protein
MTVPRVLAVLTLAGAVTLTLTACGLTIPTDPDGALDRVDGGVLRVGASPSDGLVDVRGDAVDGPIPDLVESFASSRYAQVEWTVGSEEDLVDALEEGQLDLAVGGMSDATPWTDRASVTRAYDDLPGTGGRSVVLLLPLGENALQAAVETFLDGEVER